MNPSDDSSGGERARLLNRLERERAARREAEAIAERGTRELYEQHRSMDLLQGIATAANESSTLTEVLQLAVKQVCRHYGWPVGHVYLPEHDPTVALVPTKIWYLETPERFETFRSVTERTLLAPGEGLPGRVYASATPAWIRDVKKDPNFPGAKEAKDIGVQSAIAFPVLLGKEVVAVLEFFSPAIVEPLAQFLANVSHIGTQLARVAERERTAEALRGSEERYRLLFESNPQPMWVYNLESLHFLAVNMTAIHDYGYSREEFLGMTLRDIRPPEDVPELMDDIARTESGLHRGGVWRHVKKDGSIISVEITSHDLMFGGRPARLVLATDVTERKSLEDQLRQSQKMEAVGRLAGGIAHDFNNLLTAITGYSDLALARLHANDPMRRNVEEIGKAANRAASLTRQLLAFSRQQVLQPRVLDVNAIVTNMEGMLRRLIGEDIRFSTGLDPDLGHLKADPGQIEQIIMNLAVNARDAMPEGGSLTIETQNVDLDETYARQHVGCLAGSYVQLAVSDTGCGMDERIRSRIFEPFFTTKELGKGTGLGLSTVYGIVKQSGGYIWVYSELARGTTFRIYLPRVQQGIQETEPFLNDTPAEEGSETILLVEDEDMVRNVAREILESKGYTVLAANGGEEALRISEAHPGPIDLVMSDLVMPGMSGREVVSHLARRRSGIGILYTSGYTHEAVMQREVLDPDVVFLPKPFTASSLERSVLEALHRKPVTKP